MSHFPELIYDELNAWFEESGEDYGVNDASDLVVITDGTEGQWWIYNKTTNYPVGSRPITRRTLDERRQRREQEADARTAALREATGADAVKAKEEYDAGIRKEEARIEYWRNRADSTGRFASSYAAKVADDLQRRLDDRMARDRLLIEEAPRVRKAAEDRRRKAEKAQRDSYQKMTPQERLAEQDRMRAQGLGMGQRRDIEQ